MFCVTVGSSTSKAEPKNCVAKVIGKPATATIVWIAVSGNHRWRGGRCVANHAHHIIHSALTGSRSPAGPRRLRNSDAHERIAVPQAFCVLLKHTQPRPKSGKVRRSDTRPGDVRERVEHAEGSDSAPSEMPVFRRVSPCVRSFEQSRVCTHFHS